MEDLLCSLILPVTVLSGNIEICIEYFEDSECKCLALLWFEGWFSEGGDIWIENYANEKDGKMK